MSASIERWAAIITGKPGEFSQDFATFISCPERAEGREDLHLRYVVARSCGKVAITVEVGVPFFRFQDCLQLQMIILGHITRDLTSKKEGPEYMIISGKRVGLIDMRDMVRGEIEENLANGATILRLEPALPSHIDDSFDTRWTDYRN